MLMLPHGWCITDDIYNLALCTIGIQAQELVDYLMMP